MTFPVVKLSDSVTLICADCRDALPVECDAVVTDPPYGLSFMGKAWDYDVPGVDIWQAVIASLKPGGHLLSFAGTRTHHRMAVNIEDAGFEIRDMIAWVYGSGFPKSLDVSKAIDKAAGAEREVVGRGSHCGLHHRGGANSFTDDNWQAKNRDGDYSLITAPATEAARQWSGWGTALKPALEPITVARKPFTGTVAANVLEHGTGAMNVDGCRVGTERPASRNAPKKIIRSGRFHSGAEAEKEMSHFNPTQGRWPANLIHDGSDEVVGLMNDAARFFYCAKASKADRDDGLDGMDERNNMRVNGPRKSEEEKYATLRRNHHPTVKPTALMRYLCRLVTPPGGIVLDPFMGSGSTGKAAILEGFGFVGIERDAKSFEIAVARCRHAMKATGQQALPLEEAMA